MADNQRPAKLLEKAFVDKTVLILAGGPSLDEVLPWLRLHRNEVVVFAVSRISRQLLQANIEPDFVFSVDPTELSFDISKEMLEFSSKPIFVYSYHTVPTLVNQWHGLGFYLGPRLPWPSPLNVANIGSAGPTVTNTALSVAYHFGFKRMVLAGVDLCFTREGFTHATGSDEQMAGPRFNLTSLQVETNAGFMAPTSCDFAQAILSLSFQAKQLSEMGCRIFNISAGSAKVDNIEYLPISEIEFGDGAINVAKIVAERISDAAEQSKYHKQILDELGRAQFQIKGIARLAENARRVNDEMYSADGVIENYKDKKRLDQIEKKFKREHRHFSKLVKSFGIRSFIKLTKAFTDEEWSAEEAKQLGNVFYDAYREGATKLMCLLDGAVERVQARQQEYADAPNFGLVIEQYRKDRSFGRVRLWKAIAELPADVQVQFADFEKHFVEIVHDKNTRHFAKAKSQGNLSSLKQRAGLLFKHKKIEELSDLLISLNKHQDQQAVEPYRQLITGYSAELQQKPAQALDAYRQIVDGGGVLVEQALIRIADIGIDSDDAHTANLALQCLSQLNPFYLPLYAEMQRLHGDVMVAIDAYNNYIGQFPQDTLVQIKLANLYTEQGIYDAAIMMLDYILAQKPDLEVAVTMKAALVSAGF
ncbi:motility associated factor glycosyltransferase family protein [Methylomonas sp. 11b]|uniref:6-hydroxymethylpterin diphosphokinase MptE-like protein n=1 Tax=Methylomonas sp. 11b TaxID=1168169 RepID=UPI001E495392